MEITVGKSAPEFSQDNGLLDQEGKSHFLKDYLGKWVLLYFYPKDDTTGCTVEACALRDTMPNFKNINAVILGISTDSVQSHKNFAQKNSLNFTLLADFNHEAAKQYGVDGQGFMGGASRTSFLISPEGKIAKIYINVNPKFTQAKY